MYVIIKVHIVSSRVSVWRNYVSVLGMQEMNGANGFISPKGLMMAYVSGKKYPQSSALFRRQPASIKSICSARVKIHIMGTVSGGATRTWPLKGTK